MTDAEIVSAIAEGQLGGLAAALEKYADPLFAYCYPMAPEVAAEAVSDTFIIGWEKLGALRNPGQLYSWLREVAGNECLRRSPANGVETSAAAPPPDVVPPALPGRVLGACADNTPAGRAYRTSAVHRAGPFGGDGFPKTGHRLAKWRRRLPRYPPTVAGAAAAAIIAVAAAVVIVATLPLGGPPQDNASAAAPGTHTRTGEAIVPSQRRQSPSSGFPAPRATATTAPTLTPTRTPASTVTPTPTQPTAPAVSPSPASNYTYSGSGDGNSQGGNGDDGN